MSELKNNKKKINVTGILPHELVGNYITNMRCFDNVPICETTEMQWRTIIENVNPIVYKTYQEYLKNKPEKCQELPLTKPYTRYLKNKVSDPVLPYSWDCQRELAVDTAKQNDCINKSYKT